MHLGCFGLEVYMYAVRLVVNIDTFRLYVFDPGGSSDVFSDHHDDHDVMISFKTIHNHKLCVILLCLSIPKVVLTDGSYQ